MNKAQFIGHLGKDPEIRHTTSGKAVANFSLATSETFKKANGEKETKTEWHNIILWSPLAEVAEKYMKKGSKVFIEGKISHRSYDDKDGIKRYVTDIVGRELIMLDSKPKEEGSKEETAKEEVAVSADASSEEDTLPF